MNAGSHYALIGAGLFAFGLYALISHSHLLRKVLAINVMGSGVFLILVALTRRSGAVPADMVPHAMVITGIVIAISATSLTLVFMLKLAASTGRADLPDSTSR